MKLTQEERDLLMEAALHRALDLQTVVNDTRRRAGDLRKASGLTTMADKLEARADRQMDRANQLFQLSRRLEAEA
jgi:hypothetical protein